MRNKAPLKYRKRKASKKSLVITIGFRCIGNPQTDTHQLLPYVKKIVEKGTVVVNNAKRQKPNTSRLNLGVLPSGTLIVLKNCPMPDDNTDTESSASEDE